MCIAPVAMHIGKVCNTCKTQGNNTIVALLHAYLLNISIQLQILTITVIILNKVKGSLSRKKFVLESKIPLRFQRSTLFSVGPFLTKQHRHSTYYFIPVICLKLKHSYIIKKVKCCLINYSA